MTAKIIVVDDEEMFLRLFKKNFRKQIQTGKYQFSYCHNGQAALIRVKNNRPDLLLIDIQMPGMKG